ncbi:MAG: helix-turn-helix domain-containing protein [Amphiplicatus sp.]
MRKSVSPLSSAREETSPESAPTRLTAPKSESSLLIAFAQGMTEGMTGTEVRGSIRASQKKTQDEAERIPLADHFRLMRRLTEASRDETLHLSKRPLAPGTTDFVIDTVLQAENLEDAMKRTARAYNMMHGGYYNRVSRRGDRLIYTIDDRGFPYAFDEKSGGAYALMEGLLIFLHALLTLSAGDALGRRLICVRSRRPSRNPSGGFLDFWDAPVRCAAAAYALEYDAAAIDLPVRRWRGTPPNAAAVYDLIDTMIADRERSGLTKDLRLRVLEALSEGVENQSDVARRLGVSIATLRRRLAETGVSFRDLRHHALNEAALSMLRQGRPVGDVAEALGYVDTRSFSRAFKAWNGMTPTAFAAQSASAL